LLQSELEMFCKMVSRTKHVVRIVTQVECPSWFFDLSGLGFNNIHHVFISTLMRDDIDKALNSHFKFHNIHDINDLARIQNPVFLLAGPKGCRSQIIINRHRPTWIFSRRQNELSDNLILFLTLLCVSTHFDWQKD
jgi:hypothetical protein